MPNLRTHFETAHPRATLPNEFQRLRVYKRKTGQEKENVPQPNVDNSPIAINANDMEIEKDKENETEENVTQDETESNAETKANPKLNSSLLKMFEKMREKNVCSCI